MKKTNQQQRSSDRGRSIRRRAALLCGVGALALWLGGCPSQETPKLAAIVPASGSLALYGESIQRGIELAQSQLAEDPNAVAFELSILDSQGDPATASRLLQEQYEAGAVAAIGGVTTDEALAMVEVADGAQRVLVSPSASGAELTGRSPKFYRVVPSDAKEGATMATFASQKLDLEEIASLTSAGSYASGIRDAFTAQFEQLGGKATEAVEVEVGSDLTDPVAQVIDAKAKAVFVAGYADEVERMIVALRGAGFSNPILTTSAFALPSVVSEIGDATRGVYLTKMVFDPTSTDPKVQSFVSAYEAAHGSKPDVFAAQGYDSVLVLAEALKELGPIPSDFWQSVRGLRDFAGVGGVIQFDERGDAQRFHRVHVVQKGEIVDFEVIEKQRAEIRKKLDEVRRRQRGG